MSEDVIYIYDAIAQMRELAASGKAFSLSFLTLNRSARSSSGITHIATAKLRKQGKDQSSSMINILDMTSNTPKQFYLPLLLEYNGKRVFFGRNE